jgi:hypothetical protein
MIYEHINFLLANFFKRERERAYFIWLLTNNGSTEAEEMKTYLIKEIETMVFFVIVLE